jgi:two-component system sensor histidine kinase/response regulator
MNNLNLPTILCVDDELDIIDAVSRQFRSKYHVLKATSGKQALKLLNDSDNKIALIIADQRMPEMGGVELLTHFLEQSPDTVRIILTGYADAEAIAEAINSAQAYRYLTKPWDPIDLEMAVEKGVELYKLNSELKEKKASLELALKELKQLDLAKNNFMILINHELKTPLTSIISYTELTLETNLSAEQMLYLNRIKKSGLRLKTLIDDTLLIVKNESNLLTLNTRALTPLELEGSLPFELHEQVKSKAQNIKFEIQTDKKMLGDLFYLNQIISRLIHNASKFGEEGSDVIVQFSSPANHRVEIAVENKGKPISLQIIEKIMNPFFLDEDVMNHSVGAGLGLTVCQALLKAHRSELQFRNLQNKVRVSFQLHAI